MSRPDTEIGRHGPFRIHAPGHIDRLGWVITIEIEGSDEKIAIRTSPHGESGMHIEHRGQR